MINTEARQAIRPRGTADPHLSELVYVLLNDSLAVLGKISPPKLSERERTVLAFLAQGFRTAEIAERLQIKEVTVNLHIQNARKRLHAPTREAAVARAVSWGLIKFET